MLEWLNEREAAQVVERGVNDALKDGRVLTPDLGGRSKTMELAAEIAKRVRGV